MIEVVLLYLLPGFCILWMLLHEHAFIEWCDLPVAIFITALWPVALLTVWLEREKH
jgi:hypothetical protein